MNSGNGETRRRGWDNDVPDDTTAYERIYIARREHLTQLDLRSCDLAAVPREVWTLSHLEDLDLSHNPITQLSPEIGKLHRLKKLTIAGTSLLTLPPEITSLSALEELDLTGNAFDTFPLEILRLSALKVLRLARNAITALPPTLSALRKLEVLDVQETHLKTLPEAVVFLPALRYIYLTSNALDLPDEALATLTTNPDLFLTFLRTTLTSVSEAKVLVIGDADVGKSSLVRRLIEGRYHSERHRTDGIEITDWYPQDSPGLTIHLWDFGGQEVMYPVHELFLGIDSVYMVVAESNRRDTKIEKWLELVRFYAPEAPLLLVFNKSDNGKGAGGAYAKWVDQYHISDSIDVSCLTGDNIDILAKMLGAYVRGLPHIQRTLPVKWVAVRHAIAVDPRNFLFSSEFDTICRQHGIEDSSTQIALLEYLRLSGVVLDYKSDQGWFSVLKPNWVTGGVYPVVTARDKATEIWNGSAFLTEAEINRLWQHGTDRDLYPLESFAFMREIMEAYRIIRRYDNDLFFVPSLLPVGVPSDPGGWQEEMVLKVEYHYAFLPRTLFHHFVVAVAMEVDKDNAYDAGVRLKRGDLLYGLVTLDTAKNIISVAVGFDIPARGQQERHFLKAIRDQFMLLHQQYGVDVKEYVRTREQKLVLYEALERLEYHNITGEYYLPDIDEVIDVSWMLNRLKSNSNLNLGTNQPQRHILGFFASPEDYPKLSVDAERRQFLEILSFASNDFIYYTIPQPTIPDFIAELKNKRPYLFHFSGHAFDEGIVLLERDRSTGKMLSWSNLATVLNEHIDTLQVIILNGCRTSSESFQRAFSHVGRQSSLTMIVTNDPISDRTTVEFMQNFYRFFINDKNVKTAFRQAKIQFQAESGLADDSYRLIELRTE